MIGDSRPRFPGGMRERGGLHMKGQKRAKLMLTAAMVIFGTLGPFVRNIPVSSGELALYRAAMAALVIALYLLAARRQVDWAAVRRELVLLLASGAAMGVNWILLFQAYQHTTVSVATLSYYFAPVIVTAACPLLFHEKLSSRQLLCFVMSTAGLILVIGLADLDGGQANRTGVLFALGAAVLYAAVILLNKYIRRTTGICRTLFQLLAAVLVLIPYVAGTSGVTLGGLNSTGWACLLVVGLVHTGIAYCLYFSALGQLPGQEAAILSYMDPLVAVLISVWVLGEPMAPTQLLGGALILGFTLWNELAPSAPQRP